jgi:hypothetical protein
MNASDLERLDTLLLAPARAVVSMREVFLGARDADVVGMRHDVDDNPGSLATAVRIAMWEAEHGYRSTYFMLHTASYWQDEATLRRSLEQIAGLDHEIGIHANSLAEALRYGGDPDDILQCAIDQLRSYGYPVTGVVGHGDPLCRQAGFINGEMFLECPRPEMGEPGRVVTYAGRRVRLAPRPLADFGLAYNAIWLPRGRTLSDSGGVWNVPPETLAGGLGQLHILQHSDWWAAAL